MSSNVGVPSLPLDSPTGFEAVVGIALPMLFETPCILQWRSENEHSLTVTDRLFFETMRGVMSANPEQMTLEQFKRDTALFWTKLSSNTTAAGGRVEMTDNHGKTYSSEDPQQLMESIPAEERGNPQMTSMALQMLMAWHGKLRQTVLFVRDLQTTKPKGDQVDDDEGENFKYSTPLANASPDEPFTTLTAVYTKGDLTTTPPGLLACVALQGPPQLGILAAMPMKFRSVRTL